MLLHVNRLISWEQTLTVVKYGQHTLLKNLCIVKHITLRSWIAQAAGGGGGGGTQIYIGVHMRVHGF